MGFISEFSNVEFNRIQNEFKRLQGVHYLDHAGATQYADSQINKIFTNFSQNVYSNPHTSKTTEDLIDQVRYKILQNFNTTTDDYAVVFTSGATASLKLLVENFDFLDENCGTFMYLRDNHTSVLGMREIVQTKNIKCIEREDFLNEQFLENEQPNVDLGRNLLVYSAQCNFNGFKYPLDVIKKVQESRPESFVCLDAASFAASNYLDLSEYPADFVCLSFYKQFGYPTGLGALLVAKRAEETLQKKYYGGGTVKIALSDGSGWHQKRDPIHERLEDGTLPFLSIISLLTGYETLENLLPAKSFPESMGRLSRHTFNVCQYLYRALDAMKYRNKRKVIKFYHDTDFSSVDQQGGLLNFNIMHEDGSYVGFAETACIANIHNISLRTGCFCNPGACQRLLKLTNADVQRHFQAGHICGDGNDLIDGVPTGSVRISVGYMTTKENVDALVDMIEECYMKTTPKRQKIIDAVDHKSQAIGIRKVMLEEPDVLCSTSLQTKPPIKTTRITVQEKSPIVKTKLLNPSAMNSGIHKVMLEEPDILRSTSLQTKPPNKTTRITVQEKSPIDQTKLLNRSAITSQVKLRQICVFPIKSCGAFRVNTRWPLTRRGLKYDREWMIVQSNGLAMTQKTDTKLCLICPKVNVEKNVLELYFPYADSIRIPLEIDMNNNKTLASLCQTKVCGDRVDGIDCGDEVADWLSDVLCTSGLRLIKQNISDKRQAKKEKKADKDSTATPQAISLSNQAQYLLINIKSVEWLANRVEEWEDLSELDDNKFLNMVDRFRGNLIIDSPVALEELDWKYVQIGDVVLKVDGQCTRCQMICIDQSTGEKTTEPLRTIAREFQGKMRFGLYLGREGDFDDTDGEVFLDCNKEILIVK